MKKFLLIKLLGLAMLAAVGSVQAEIIFLSATLIPGEEPPPPVGRQGLPALTCPVPGPACPANTGVAPRPEAFGTASFVLDTSALTMKMTVTVFNIDVTGVGLDGSPGVKGSGTQTPSDSNDDLVAAHIHVGVPGAIPPQGVPGVSNAGVRWGFFGTPFNNTDDDGTMIAFLSGAGGTFTGEWDAGEGNGTTLAAQIPGILSGLAYINYHTGQFSGGEIRGQIVPEPATLGLLALGLAAFGLRWRKVAA